MNFRLAVIQDLPQIKKMYCDIMNNRLYLMLDNTEILSAFALCESNSGESAVEWEGCSGKALQVCGNTGS